MEKRYARDIMTRDVLTVFEELPVTELARTLTENSISGAPVLDKHGKLVGVVSATDIMSNELKVSREVVSESEYYGRPEVASRSEMRQLGIRVEDYGDVLVRDIMTPIIISAPPDATVSELAERMAMNKVHRVLIVDGDTVLGVVSALDLVGLLPGSVGDQRGTAGEVLLATDLGPDAEAAGARAVQMALDAGSKLLVLHVTPNLSSLMSAYGDRPELADLQKGFEETALERLAELGKKLCDGAVSYELLGRSGDPASVIAAVIEERRPACVVIGAERPPEARLRGIGSVAEKVLKMAGTPILLVPRAA